MRRLRSGWLGCCLLVAFSCGKGSPANHGDHGTGGAPEGGAGGEEPSGEGGAEQSASGGMGGAEDSTLGGGGIATAEGGVGGGLPVGGAVTGVVLRGYEPVAGVTVVLDDAMTTTKADGTFSFPSAAPLY